MTSRLKNRAGPTSLAASIRISTRGLSGGATFEMLVGVLDHHDRGIDHGADRDGDAAEAHDVGAEPDRLHRGEGHQDADRQHEDGDERAAQMQQEHDADERDDRCSLRSVCPSGFRSRASIRPRAVIDRYDLGAFRQAAGDLGKPRLDVLDDRKRIGAEALQHDAARDFAFAIELGDAAPFVGDRFRRARHPSDAEARPGRSSARCFRCRTTFLR